MILTLRLALTNDPEFTEQAPEFQQSRITKTLSYRFGNANFASLFPNDIAEILAARTKISCSRQVSQADGWRPCRRVPYLRETLPQILVRSRPTRYSMLFTNILGNRRPCYRARSVSRHKPRTHRFDSTTLLWAHHRRRGLHTCQIHLEPTLWSASAGRLREAPTLGPRLHTMSPAFSPHSTFRRPRDPPSRSKIR